MPCCYVLLFDTAYDSPLIPTSARYKISPSFIHWHLHSVTLIERITSEVANDTMTSSSTIVCDDVHNCRTIPGIIVSCASTVFLCTWVALHPDIPKYPYNAWWKIVSTRFKEKPIQLMFMTLIAPEAMVIVAFVDWITSSMIWMDIIGKRLRIIWTVRCSRYLLERHSDCKWTETHAQLLNMGGFQIVNEDGTLYILEDSQLESITSSHPHILEIPVEEIEDKSKGDFIAKMIVVIQTLWFALQVINRVNQGLSVTALELTTLAYTVLNIFIYWCWWHKPVNVRFPLKVYPKSMHRCYEGNSPRQEPWIAEYLTSNSFPLPRRLQLKLARYIQNRKPDREEPRKPDRICYIFPRRPRLTLAQYINDLADGSDSLASWQAAVGIICGIVIGGTFGAIHCLAWNAHFPTHIEANLWRASAVIVTATPGTLIPLAIATSYSDEWRRARKWKNVSTWTSNLPLGFPYLLARICLLVLALLSLRALPYDAYVVATWTIYIPHI